MNETHEKGAQLLAVERVLLLCDVNFNMSGRDVIQQHSHKLDQESKTKGWEGGKKGHQSSSLTSEGPSKQPCHPPGKGFLGQRFLCLAVRLLAALRVARRLITR